MQIWTPESFRCAVRALRLIHHASETSGGRSAARNRARGGDPHSQHLEDLAEDLVCDEPARHERLAADARTLGLIAVVDSDHVHIQAYSRGAHARLRALLDDA
ncbi:MAG TPA: D-Ala-D-Ala carboxypeptidase family metallohydrolase [Roseiflexaceae bacterium]